MSHRTDLTAVIQKFQQIEISGMFILSFFLPVFDAPKYLGYCLLIIGAAGWRLADSKIKLKKPSFLEAIIIIILSIALISTIINWPLHYGIKGFKRSFYFFTTFWILANGKYKKDTVKKAMLLLVAGTVIASLTGFWQFTHGNMKEFNLLSLNAINRSAAYISIIIFVCIGIILDNCSEYSLPLKFFSTAGLLLMFLSLFIMGSRGSILSVIITLPILFIFIFKDKVFKKFLSVLITFAIIALLLTALIYCFPNSKYLQRFRHVSTIKLTLNPSEMTYNDQMRYDYWRIGLTYAFNNLSAFGIGPRNFREIDISHMKFKRPLTAVVSQLFKQKKALHAHNWMITLLVEQGFLGLIFFVSFLITITIRLIRNRPDKMINAVWIAAFSTCFLPWISGLFNSSLSDENGWLIFCVLGLGMWFVHENQYHCKG